MTRISLVSTIQVADVPRHLNAALNWAFDEADWRNALPSDVPAADLLTPIKTAWRRLEQGVASVGFGPETVASARKMLRDLYDRLVHALPNARLVVE